MQKSPAKKRCLNDSQSEGSKKLEAFLIKQSPCIAWGWPQTDLHNSLTCPRLEYLVNRVPSTRKPNRCSCINSMISGMIISLSCVTGRAWLSHSSRVVRSCCHRFVISAYVSSWRRCLNLGSSAGCWANARVICSRTTLNTCQKLLSLRRILNLRCENRVVSMVSRCSKFSFHIHH